MRSRTLVLGAMALAGLVACDDQVDGPVEGQSSAPIEAKGEASEATGDPDELVFEMPESTRMLPIPEPGRMQAWDGDEDDAELEVYSAVITAVDCAKRMEEEDDPEVLHRCSPLDAARSGFAIYDPAEEELYLLDPAAFHHFELEEGFAGSMDISGTIIGTRHELPVLQAEDYTITPKPPPGAFKGCL